MWQWTLCLTVPSSIWTHDSMTQSTPICVLPLINCKQLLTLSSSVFLPGRHKDWKSQARDRNSLSRESRFPQKCLHWSVKKFVSFTDADSRQQCPQCCGWDKTNSHRLPKSCGEKRDGVATLSRQEHLGHSLKGRVPWPLLALTGFYWLSNSIHRRRLSFIMLRFALGNYFLQITKERVLLISSYRLTRKNVANAR